MSRNVSIVAIILVLVVVAGYLVWLRSQYQAPVSPQAEEMASPSVTASPEASPSPLVSPSASASASPKVSASPKASVKPSASPAL